MATSETTCPEAFLLALFPPELIRKTAHLVGAVKRKRLVDILSLILVVVLTPSGQGEQPIAGMRRELERRTGLLLARSSFWARLSPNFGRLVRWMLDSVVQRAWSAPPPLLGFLAGFKDVIAGDATVVQVHKSLASKWKGTGSPAAIKVHTLVRALTGELLRYKITAETQPECRVFGVGHWAKDVLFLLDRGYSAAALWWRIHRVGGFFVTRLKKSFQAEQERLAREIIVARKHKEEQKLAEWRENARIDREAREAQDETERRRAMVKAQRDARIAR